MKSFNQFLGEAEEKTPERKKLELNISKEAPGQQSLPGMGRSATRTGQGSGQGKPPNKKPQYNPKYYNADGTLKPNAVQTYIQGRMAREYNRPGVPLTPETKARLDSANKTFTSAAKGDEAASKQVAQWNKEFQAKHGVKPAETVSVPVKPRKPADDAFAKKLELDTPQGAAAAQDAARDMEADIKKGQTSLSGKPAPQIRTPRIEVPSTEKPARRTGQGSRPTGSTAVRGGAPQLPNIPRGAARVTYGQGAAPTQSFAAFSQKATAMKPPASAATQKRVAQAATAQAAAAKPPTIQQQVAGAAKDVMSDMEKKKLERQTANARTIGRVARPIANIASSANQVAYGQSQGESLPTSLTRAVVVPGVSSALANRAARQLIRRKLPAWAVPAAAATYNAAAPVVSKGFDMVRDALRGNK